MTRYAIIGFGCAGYHAALEIRRRDPEGAITVYSAHDLAPYNPMLTTYYVAGKLPYEGAFPFGSLSKIAARLRLEIRTGTAVKKVHGGERSVELEDGTREVHDQILIATGARAFAPPIQGLPPERTFLMRTMEDAVHLKAELEHRPCRSAIVVGASMVGIKVVELLHARGIRTTLADLAPCIFPLAAYPEVAEEIQRRLTAQGVELAFQNSITLVEEQPDGVLRCTLTNGERRDAELVVLCIGTRANTALVDPQEIQVGRGIVVDPSMRTSCPGVYAAGDCCEGGDLQAGDTKIIGLWANAGHQGGTAGLNMAGGKGRFTGNILHNITHFMGMDFIGMGDNRLEGEVLTCGTLSGGGTYIRAVVDGGRLLGVNILDDYRISGAVKNYFYRRLTETGATLDPVQRGILLKEGLRPSFLQRLEEVLP